jgi:hypothetical protein
MENKWECLDCQSCTSCARSDSECKAYSEYFKIILSAEKESVQKEGAAA